MALRLKGLRDEESTQTNLSTILMTKYKGRKSWRQNSSEKKNKSDCKINKKRIKTRKARPFSNKSSSNSLTKWFKIWRSKKKTGISHKTSHSTLRAQSLQRWASWRTMWPKKTQTISYSRRCGQWWSLRKDRVCRKMTSLTCSWLFEEWGTRPKKST